MTQAAAKAVARNYMEIALQYCEDVVEGRLTAGLYIRQACERQLTDLRRAYDGDPDFPFRFDAEKADHVCWFIETLPHIKGEWAKRRETLTLEPWQVFILTTLFGWVRISDGMRRFRSAYLEVARKNAKSTIGAGIELYMGTADGEAGPEIYTAATKKEQAAIVFNVVQEMLRKTPQLRQHYKIQVQAHRVIVGENTGKFSALEAKGSTLDGLNPHCVVNDEVHAWSGRELYEVLESATGARRQALIVDITTAGFNRDGICYERRAYAIRILAKKVSDETLFCAIYTLDKDDDWTDRTVWIKANPNLGVSVYPDDIDAQMRQAQAVSSKRNGFLTKRMNIWCNSASDWMNMQAWDRCGDDGLKLADFAGCEAIAALDLATKKDIASRILLIERDGIVNLFARHYCPVETVESGENASYAGWVEDGWLTATPGPVISQDRIKDDLIEDSQIVDLQEAVFDKWQGGKLMGELDEEGLIVVDLANNVANMSEAMKELEALVLAGTLRHQNDPVLTWMVSNVVCFLDEKDNIFPRKETKNSKNKIDAAVAAIMGLNRLMARRESQLVSPWDLDPNFTIGRV